MSVASPSGQIPTNAPGVKAEITVTPAAVAAVQQLIVEHGPLMFIESHGCCDNSAPMCFAEGDFLVGVNDAQIGQVAGCPYYVDARTLKFRTAGVIQLQMELDVEPGYSDGMSLGPPGSHFVLRPVLAAAPDQG